MSNSSIIHLRTKTAHRCNVIVRAVILLLLALFVNDLQAAITWDSTPTSGDGGSDLEIIQDNAAGAPTGQYIGINAIGTESNLYLKAIVGGVGYSLDLTEDAVHFVGRINGTFTGYWYINIPTAGNGTFQVEAYDGDPADVGTLISTSPTYTITSTDADQAAAANKLDRVVVNGTEVYPTAGNANIQIGQEFDVVVDYLVNSGNRAANLRVDVAARAEFDPTNTRLLGAQVTTYTDTGFTTVNESLSDQLYFKPAAGGINAARVTYRFVTIGTAAVNLSPLVSARSGQYKYNTDYTDYSITITAPTNTVTLSKSASPNTLPSAGGTTTYSVAVDNASGIAVNLDEFVDVLPASASYVASSGSFNGTPVEPVISGQTLTFPGVFNVPTTGGILTYDVVLPSVDGSYVNSAVAFINGNQIDTTAPLGDNAPATATVIVGSSADLAITKTDGATEVNAGSVVEYTLNVINNSSIDIATNVIINDLVPAALLSPEYSTDGIAYFAWPGSNTLNIGDILPTGNSTLFIRGTLDGAFSGLLSNTASVSSDIADPVSTNNSATDETTVLPPQADLSITKIVNNATPNVGDIVAFTVTLTNAGPNDASNVVVRDLLPAGYTYDAAGTSVTQGSYDPVTGDWTLGTVLLSAPVQTLSLSATVNGTGSHLNIAEVWASDLADPDSSPGNSVNTEDDYAEASVTPKEADLSIVKTADTLVPLPGTNVTFLLTVTNSGPDTATGVTVEDRIPAGLSYVSSRMVSSNNDEPGIIPTVTHCSILTATVTCDLNTVSVGTDDVIEVITVVDSGTQGQTLTNVAEVMTANEYDSDSEHGNGLDEDDQSSLSIIVASPTQTDLSLTKTVDNAAPTVGQTINYTIVVSNAGPDDTDGVAIVDTLPVGVSFVSAVVTGGDTSESCSIAGSDVTCALGTVTTTAPETITIAVTIDAGQQGNTLTNYVEITAAAEPDPDSQVNNGTYPTPVQDDEAAVDVVVTTAPTYVLSGVVYADININGVKDKNEVWGTGTTVFVNLVQAGTVIDSVQRNPGNGRYEFAGISDGDYTIVITDSAVNTSPVVPVGWLFINPVSGSRAVTVAGTDFEFQNFGLYHGSVLSGTVFLDDGASIPLSTGTANDGIQNGEEVGLEGVTVRVADDLTGSTVYDTTITDANGNYSLYLPNSQASSTLYITETNLPTYVSTAGTVGNTGGTYSLASDTVTFNYVAGNNYTGVNFADVLDNIFTNDVLDSTFSNDGRRTTFAGTYVSYSHEFTAGSEGTVTFSISDVSSPTNSGWVETLYQDVDCDGVIDAGDNEITAAITLNTGESICIILSQLTPVDASYNDYNEVTITSSFAYTNSSVVRVYTRTDVTTIGDVVEDDLNLVKSVDKTAALPGETLTYTINYSNTKTDPLDNIVINDTTSAFTTFVSATCVTPLPNNISACSVTVAPSIGGTGAIEWTLTGTLLSTGSGTVEFQVMVDP